MAPDEDLLSIGPFARQARLSVHRLRRYHDLGLLEPALVDAESGYRYYSLAQVARAEAIAVLRSLDLPLAEVQRLLLDPSDDNVARVLAQHRERLEERLGEARDRLRRLDELADERRWTVVPEDGTELVEVRLDSVRSGVGDLDRDEMLLVEVGGPRVLTIWIGPAEADAINARLQGLTRERPMAHDLMANLLRPFDVDVAKVVVTLLDQPVFLAEVHLRRHGREVVVDARPSDAVSLAVRAAAPIFVAAPVFAAAQALQARPADVPPRPDLVHFELVDKAGKQFLQGWAVPNTLKVGPFEVQGVRGQLTTYEILEVQELGDRGVRGVARLVSRRQRETEVPN
jgi:bifunctional DNase/RNase